MPHKKERRENAFKKERRGGLKKKVFSVSTVMFEVNENFR